jgi:thioredoxin reductase/NAD-dependent dihydropyrimidine dehydrogenase PreA subunit
MLVYLLPLAAIWFWYQRRGHGQQRRSVAALDQARAAGLAEPVSLHPLIDPALCVGCGACVRACPEQAEHAVLGLIDRKAALLEAGNCIGHGACRAACPAGAISLVFGSERRGIDIPMLTPQFETSVPGMFIAGELGGMGLIRNALEQGRQAIDAIAARARSGTAAEAAMLDLVIVGAGPAGFSASLAALAHRLRFETIEQESLGGSVFQYPRGKLVMTAPAELPLVGKVRFRNTSKEDLLAFWQDVERKTGLQIRYRHRVEGIDRLAHGFRVRTSGGELSARFVLLAIGRRGTPRKLGVEGEELPKVVYRLLDPEQYRGQRVLVVGGGDSALEAAASIAELDGTEVTLSYRGAAFDRAKARNRERVQAAVDAGRLRALMQSNVLKIEPDVVLLDQQGRTDRITNDAVIVSAGGILPTAFLQSLGIAVETKHGTA